MNVLVSFGEAVVDLLGAREDPSAFRAHAGGSPANVAAGFARLGGRSRLVGMRGDDRLGEFLESQLIEYGVDVRFLLRTARANTALTVISLDEAGERSFQFYRPPSAGMLYAAEDLPDAAFEGAGIFHFCSNTLSQPGIRAATLGAIAAARAAGCIVSFDLNLRPALWPDAAAMVSQVMPVLSAAHLIKASREEWLALTRGAADRPLLDALFAGGVQARILTDGERPIRFTSATMDVDFAVSPVAVVDSTAAGDAFVAGMLFGLARAGASPATLAALLADAALRESILGLAVRCGSAACTRFGAFASLPRLADVEPA